MSKELMGKAPTTFITDGLPAYHRAFKHEFQGNHGNEGVHIREITLRGRVHNNKMERLNGEFRDREKVMRGIKTAGSPILKGYQIYHNFVRPHEALNGRTPADLAGIKVLGENKWETLIRHSAYPAMRNGEQATQTER